MRGAIVLTLACAFGLSGCLFSAALDERAGAPTVLGSADAAPDCGLRGFQAFAQPFLRANCASCHAGFGPGNGAFAAESAGQAYPAARARVSFADTAASLLVQRPSISGHGPGCANCGPAIAPVLSAALAKWGQAEVGTYAVCSTLQAGDSGGGFSDGTYNPGGAAGVEIVPAGLVRFSESGGVHSALQASCAECHSPGGQAAFAPFGGADATIAYREAKLRVNFVDVAGSKLLQRAGTDSHCGACGDAGLVAELRAGIDDWKTAEAAGAAATRVTLAAKPVGVSAAGQTAVLSWALGADAAPADADLAGAVFEVTVTVPAAPFDTVYLFSKPRIHTASRAIEVKEVRFVLNGVEDPLVATWTTVDQTVASGQSPGPVLNTASALVPMGAAGADAISFAFKALQAP
jgi:hypothetical protein